MLGFVLLVIGSGLSLAAGLTVPVWPEASRQRFIETWQPTPERFEAELVGTVGLSCAQIPGFPHQRFSFMGLLALWRLDADRHGSLQTGILPAA